MIRSALAGLVAAAALAVCVSGASAAAKPPIAGPDVRTGKHVALAQHAGRPVFVTVWGSWCGGCIAEAPVLARFAKAHAAQIAFLGIDTIDSKSGARSFYRRYGFGYPSIWDPRGTLAGAWSRGAPTTLVFDRRHRLVKRIEGTATKAQLASALRQVTRT